MKSISYQNVTISEGFLGTVSRRNRLVTLNAVYDRFFETNRITAVTRNWPEGADRTVHRYWDSDVAKWMESAAYVLCREDDPKLQAKVEELIDAIERYQLPDGYFNSCYGETERFLDRNGHELYCAGHYMEAAVAYYEATGRDRFLKCMCRYADFIDDCFRKRQTAAFLTPGHEEIELALIRLYRATGQR
ncbi:MAG: glycoside hydrolase family 127 protein, partial [Lachnospiraceae bacterium]|nr:glycoside hydrolase family 127 protein [Lachnospiraceae bacterium]